MTRPIDSRITVTLPTMTRPRYLPDDQTAAFFEPVAADPLTPVSAAVVAPGGYGKTRLLAELDQVYRRAGLANEDVLLVDDAHLLPPEELARLRERALGPAALIVACRPWPRPHALAELLDLLGRRRPAVLPGPLGVPQIGRYLTSRLGFPPPNPLVEAVFEQTGGVPRFVEWFALALPSSSPDVDLQLPPQAVAEFRAEWDRMEPVLQQLLLAMEAGMGLQPELLGALLDTDGDGLADAMAAARATGLLTPADTLLPVARRAIGTLAPGERRVAVRRRLAELQRERGGPVLGLARSLLGTGAGGPSVAATFEVAAGEALPDRPAQAAQLFAAAVEAGRPALAVAGRWAQAAALAGDLDTALRLADRVIGAAVPDSGGTAPRAADRPAAALVAATALAHRGQLGRSAELLRWGRSGVLAVIALIGTGQLAEAESLLDTPAGDAPPTLLAGAAPLMARGVHESVFGSATTALSTLVRAAALLEPAGQAVLLPDSPAALTGLVGLHAGELTIAESVLTRAVTAGVGGELMSARHRLLLAWIAMARGDTAAATAALAAVTNAATHLEPRDWLYAVGLEVGLARRSSDLPTLRKAWAHACEAILRHPVDLFTLLPLGEFAIAAARLRDSERLAPHLEAARTVLAQLGDPPLWSAQVRWSGLHAAVLAERPAEASEHAAALAALAPYSRYCAALAAAAQSWLAVLAGQVDPSTVEAAARGLHDAGLCWDGARLAGQAAIRTPDRKAMVALLDCARLLQGRTPVSSDRPATPVQARSARRLSDREQEVADLVLAGMTYKQIGDRLFISAKTVEHHVARIRQRLGCTSRSDLLARLRELSADRDR